MTALDDLRLALSTVERWRDNASEQPWTIDIDPSGWPEVISEDELITETINADDPWLIVGAVTLLLDDDGGVARLLLDAIRRTEFAGLDIDTTALRLANTINRIEATR